MTDTEVNTWNSNIEETLGPNKKERTNAAAYVGLYPFLRDVAAGNGYALAVHGSMARDFDLIAIPWTKEAISPEGLLKEFCDGFGLKLATEEMLNVQDKPHGRLSYILYFVFWRRRVAFGLKYNAKD